MTTRTRILSTATLQFWLALISATQNPEWKTQFWPTDCEIRKMCWEWVVGTVVKSPLGMLVFHAGGPRLEFWHCSQLQLLTAWTLREAAEDGSRSWNPSIQEGGLDWVPSSYVHYGLTLAVVGCWWTSQKIRNLSCPSLSLFQQTERTFHVPEVVTISYVVIGTQCRESHYYASVLWAITYTESHLKGCDLTGYKEKALAIKLIFSTIGYQWKNDTALVTQNELSHHKLVLSLAASWHWSSYLVESVSAIDPRTLLRTNTMCPILLFCCYQHRIYRMLWIIYIKETDFSPLTAFKAGKAKYMAHHNIGGVSEHARNRGKLDQTHPFIRSPLLWWLTLSHSNRLHPPDQCFSADCYNGS